MFVATFPDAELEGGITFWNYHNDLERSFFARSRIGILRIRDPLFLSLNLGIDVGGPVGSAVGLHGMLTHLWSGLFFQVFINRSFENRRFQPGAALGWSLFGLEMQLDAGDRVDVWLSLKFRIPIAIFLYGKLRMSADVQRHTRSF